MHRQDANPTSNLAALSLGALGVVYGDIGTSPLYALRECFHGEHGIPLTRLNIFGVLSLIFWSLVIVITVKYLIFVLRADNRGEGGILALLALIPRPLRQGKRAWLMMTLGLFGAALLYGDGMITPAISVLSAVEGLRVATHAFDQQVVPITIAILVGLFFIQSRGTGGIGKVFGPVMLLWFATLTVLGVSWIVREPGVLAAVNPSHAASFFLHNHVVGFLTLGSVFLVVTGGEALYADMGHFGKRPIQLAWFILVLPALLLNYFGQGALLLSNPKVVANPFYHLAPDWALFPLVGLATVATVIASQAVISGAFSLTRQAIQLGYSPRLEIVHTSEEEIGQIYIPSVNWALMVATIALVLGFQGSTHLAAAYGIAVTATMGITSLLAAIVAVQLWKWPLWGVVPVALSFLVIDLSFFGANAIKFLDGGWVPLLVATLVYLLMATWKSGRTRLSAQLAQGALPFESFITSVSPTSPHRVPGTAVFMTRDSVGTPLALLHNLKHNKVLHDRVILLSVSNEEIPQVSRKERVQVEPLGKEFYRVIARYGFMEFPNVPELLERTRAQGLDLSMMTTTYFLSRETLLPSHRRGLAGLRDRLFGVMARNSVRPTDYFRLPPNRVIELGTQVRLG